ncbi:DUF4397 domain-containing protein [Chitinophaga filiformis]|uniref:DUF4397 domain-containing protein n=1 Tax=Chitinophaga filiformis TaxID=104663 RepID=UPI001F27FF02|nr:DUF4397 domain-containing protein [Chitinophaga filiformis]MCF6405694.1 DUF4397 domain-containing protein [Chitinophaga filiformis]
MKQGLYLVLLLIVAGVMACSKDSDSSIPETSSSINFFTAVPNQEFDVTIDTASIGTGLGYGESTGYHAFQAKRYTLLIYRAGNHTTPIGGGEVSLRNGHYYSVFLSQNNSRTLQLLLVEDNLAPSKPNFGKVRFINLSDTYVNAATRLTLDFYVDGVRNFRRQSYQASTDFLEVPVGTRNVDVRYADSSLSLMGANSRNYEIQDQKQYTIIGYGNALKADSFKLATFAH